jgi:hypothetical protein
LIAASAAEYTFLRASGFAANTLSWAGQIRQSDVLRWFHPEARRALVHEADLAAVGVRALTGEGHNRMAYHLTGPQQLTQVEQLQTIGQELGRPLRFEETSTVQAARELFPGLPAEVVASIVDGHAAFVDHPEPVTDVVEQLTGRPALSFARWAKTTSPTSPGGSDEHGARGGTLPMRGTPGGGARSGPSLTVLLRPAVGGERGGGAGQEKGGGEHDGGNPEAVQDADAVAEKTNHWRPGEEGHVAD